MRRARFGHRTLAVALVVAAALVACGTSDDAVDRATAVRGVVDGTVAPAYRRAVTASRRAAAAATRVCGSDEPVALLAQPVQDAYAAWQALDPIDFGPATTLRAKSQLVYPPDPDRVTRLLAAGGPADAAVVHSRTAAGARGYAAAAILTEAESDREARCRYLEAVLTNGRAVAETVGAAWFDAEPPYVDRARGDGAKRIQTQAMLDMIVNMGLNALGADAAAVVADRLNGDNATASIAAARKHLDTISAWWGRSAEDGLRRLVDDELAGRFAEELARVRSASDAKAFGEAVNAVRATLGTEVVSALDITVGFSDNDGDS